MNDRESNADLATLSVNRRQLLLEIYFEFRVLNVYFRHSNPQYLVTESGRNPYGIGANNMQLKLRRP